MKSLITHLLKRMKNIKTGAFVSVASYHGVNEDLMCKFCNSVVMDSCYLNPSSGVPLCRCFKPDYRKVYIYSTSASQNELLGKIYSKFTNKKGKTFENFTIPSQENLNIYIRTPKNEMTSSELEKDIKKIKPDYIFLGEMEDYHEENIKLLEFFRRITKEINAAGFWLADLKSCFLWTEEENEKYHGLSDIVLTLDAENAITKITVEKGKL